MNDSDYREWKNHPVTTSLFDWFKKELSGIEEEILYGGYLHEGGKIERLYNLFGKKEVLELVLAVQKEDLNQEELSNG